MVLLVGWGLYKALSLRAFYLAFLAKRGPSSIPALIYALEDESEPMRAVTVGYLAKFGDKSIGPLTQALRDRDSNRREGAAICLALIARRGNASMAIREALPALRKALKDDDPRVRVQAARAVWILDKMPNEVVPVLRELWNGGSLKVRFQCARVLEEIGPDAKEAAPALRESLKDQNELVRRWAKTALESIDPKKAANAGVP